LILHGAFERARAALRVAPSLNGLLHFLDHQPRDGFALPVKIRRRKLFIHGNVLVCLGEYNA
jgi:hypothetical protein